MGWTMTGQRPSQRRELLAFGRPIEWSHEGQLGTVFFGPEKGNEFPPLPIGNVKDLIEEEFLDPTARHNDAPPAGDLVEWAQTIRDEYEEFQLEVALIGYMVGPHREDARIRLNGVSIRSPGALPAELKRDVVREFDPELLSVNDIHIEIIWD